MPAPRPALSGEDRKAPIARETDTHRVVVDPGSTVFIDPDLSTMKKRSVGTPCVWCELARQVMGSAAAA